MFWLTLLLSIAYVYLMSEVAIRIEERYGYWQAWAVHFVFMAVFVVAAVLIKL